MIPIEHATDADPALISAFAAAGFQIEHTGGNCHAYVRDNGDDTVSVVTLQTDAALPDFMHEICTLGTYTRACWYETGGDTLSLEDIPAREILARFSKSAE